ncbi:MAG: hypothetical protein RLZZ189_1146, partial [Pseudomonadota bacterium]
DLADDKLFWDRFDFLNNPNNHHHLLGNWLNLLDQTYDLHSIIEESKGIKDPSDENVGDVVLANLLSFSQSHGKALEMFNWLVSRDGKNFLTYFDDYNTYVKPLLSSCQRTYATMVCATNKSTYLKSFADMWFINTIPQPVLK